MTAEPVAPAEIRSSPARGRHIWSPRAESSRLSGRSGPRILLVDDEVSVRESLGKVLRDAGYEPVLAANGQEALERFDPRHIDLLLLDIGLPIMNGWVVFERIAARSPDTPVIVITGQTVPFPMAVAAGAGALLEKPLDVARLLETIRSLLSEAGSGNARRHCGQGRAVRHLPPDRALLLRKLREGYSTPFRCTRPDGKEGAPRD